MLKRFGIPIVGMVILLGTVFGGWWLANGKVIPVLAPTGEVGSQETGLILFALGLSAIVVIPVYVMLFSFAFRFHKSNKKAVYRPDWSTNKWLEGLWWGIPIVIIGVLAAVAYQTSHQLDPYKHRPGGQPLTVQVVALQWRWLFIYPDQNVASLNQVALPKDRPVHFVLTADAPMSAFWIPALGSQIYAMSGMASQLNLKPTKLGDFKGYSTNINGAGYADMIFTARVMSPAAFDQWVAAGRRSVHHLDETAYAQLAKPRSDAATKLYSLTDPDLFDSVLAKYMGHAVHESHMMDMEPAA
jgi:cytochrome o ubiquinol oxidase subunit 2